MSMSYSPLQFTVYTPQKKSFESWKPDQIIAEFCATILPNISEENYPLETFLYLLSTKNKGVASGWKSLVKAAQRSNQECFEIICNHFSPLHNIIYFSHFPRGTQAKTRYPYILEHRSDEYQKIQSQCPQLIGPPVTAYTLASTLRNYPIFMNALYNTGNAVLPYKEQSFLHGLTDKNIQSQSVLPGHPTNIRLFNIQKSLALIQKHINGSNQKKSSMKLLLLIRKKCSPESTLLPELASIIADYYIPSLIFIPADALEL